MAKAVVTVVFDRVKKVAASMAALNSQRVMVGIPAEKSERSDDDEKQPIGNAAIGYLMEYGSPEMNLPARPHLIPGVKSVKGESIAGLRAAAIAALNGETSKVNRELNKVGLINQNAVRKKITDGPFAPLSERTLAARRRRGRKGTKPLIDTGQYRRATTYVIRKR